MFFREFSIAVQYKFMLVLLLLEIDVLNIIGNLSAKKISRVLCCDFLPSFNATVDYLLFDILEFDLFSNYSLFCNLCLLIKLM